MTHEKAERLFTMDRYEKRSDRDFELLLLSSTSMEEEESEEDASDGGAA